MSPMKGWLGSPPGIVTVVELGFQLAEMAGPETGGLRDVGFDWSGLYPPRISACGVGIFVGHGHAGASALTVAVMVPGGAAVGSS